MPGRRGRGRGDRGSTARQRAHACGRRARAGRGRVPVLGLRALKDAAALGRDARRGRPRAQPRGLKGGVGPGLPEGLEARALDGARPRRHATRRRSGGHGGEAHQGRWQSRRSAHRRGRGQPVCRHQGAGDRERGHCGNSSHSGARPGRVLDQPSGGHSARAPRDAGRARRRRRRRRAGAGVCPAGEQGHGHRGRADVPRPRRAGGRHGPAPAPGGGRDHDPAGRRRRTRRQGRSRRRGQAEVGKVSDRRAAARRHRPPRELRGLARRRPHAHRAWLAEGRP